MESDEHLPENRIAIVGFAGRFPGARDVDELWQNLTEARESIVRLDGPALREAGAPAKLLNSPNAVRDVMLLEDADCFDGAFFGYHTSQAAKMDPQQRVFLEVAWRALEHAGCNIRRRCDGIGVFAGNTPLVVERGDDAAAIMQEQIDSGLGSIATRTSYKLDLRGPSLAIQTACSTSLVAVHYAVQSLLNYDCDIAIAGGSSITAQVGYVYQKEGILSPDGRCRAYDAEANGTTPGCGACAVILKRLEDAVSEGDRIYAVIRGTAVNNDGGRKVGYTAPSVEGQIDVISRALAVAGVEPETIGLVEGHGTGTSLGDAIEIAALDEVFRREGAPSKHCVLGSIKANIGHLDVAAGVAGLIKATLCLSQRTLVAAPNVRAPSELLLDDSAPLYINTRLREWEQAAPRRAGVSSFGIGGTNAHVVLEEYSDARADFLERPHLIVLSAKTQASVQEYASNLRTWIENDPSVRLDDLALTLQTGRAEFEHRLVCVASTIEELAHRLRSAAASAGDAGRASAMSKHLRLHFAHGDHIAEPPPCLEQEPAAAEMVAAGRAMIARADGEVQTASGRPSALSEGAFSALQQALYVCYAAALGRTLLAWGLQPSLVSGSGVGLLAAAVALGKLSINQALDRASALWGQDEAEFNAELHEWSELLAGVAGREGNERSGSTGWSGSVDDPAEAEPFVLSISADPSRDTATGAPGVLGVISIGLSSLSRAELLGGLGRLWAKGGPIVWTQNCAGRSARRTGLPGHPFVRERFPPHRHSAPAEMQEEAPAGHPFKPATGERQSATVHDLWREVFRVDHFDEEADFISLGGDSILAVQLLSRIEDVFGVEIPLMLILRNGATAGAIAQTVAIETMQQAS